MALTTLPTAAFATGSVGTSQLADSSVTANKVSADLNFRNYVVNGDISVWQRGTSFTNAASGTFTADRWCMSYRAIGNADIAQVDNKTYKSLKVTNSNGSSQEIAMRYRVEDVTQFNNNSFVLSFYAKASTSVTLDTRVYENYGSGGSATVTVVAAGSQNKTITTSRQRFTISFTTSDMSGKTIGSSNYLEFSFHPTLVSGANWEFDSVQLEKGTVVSDFELVPYDVNLTRCSRYYTEINQNGANGWRTFAGRVNGAADVENIGITLPTFLRTGNPTVTKSGSCVAQAWDDSGYHPTSAGGGTFSVQTDSGNNTPYLNCKCNGFSGLTGGAANISFVLGTPSIAVDAEL